MTTDHKPVTDEEFKDILIKAAEDVQQGMWCSGALFQTVGGVWDMYLEIVPESLSSSFISLDESVMSYSPMETIESVILNAEKASKSHRCAQGSIALAAALLGHGRQPVLEEILSRADELVTKALYEHCSSCAEASFYRLSFLIVTHNDCHMRGYGPFEAGVFWAEIFRESAEAL